MSELIVSHHGDLANRIAGNTVRYFDLDDIPDLSTEQGAAHRRFGGDAANAVRDFLGADDVQGDFLVGFKIPDRDAIPRRQRLNPCLRISNLTPSLLRYIVNHD